MNGARRFAAAIALVLFGSAPAPGFVKCEMPDGRLLFVDVPPPGCVLQGELKNAPEEPSAPSESGGGEAAESPSGSASGAGEAAAIAQGRRIERELEDAADELERVKQDRENAPKAPPGVYVDVTDGSGHYKENEFIAPNVAAELDAREKKVLERIQGLRDEYANVTRTIEEQNGGRAPSWWSSSPRCDRCP